MPDDGDTRLFESGAIVHYILERHKNGDLKLWLCAPEFPDYLQWFRCCEGIVLPQVNIIVVNPILLPSKRQGPTALGQAQRVLVKSFSPLERAISGIDILSARFQLQILCLAMLAS